MNNGWVRLWRKTIENVFLMHDPNAYMVFTKLLLKVDSNGRWSGGRKVLADFMDMPESTLYKTLLRLEREQLISIQSNRRYTIYSICKWSHYQSSGNRPNTLVGTVRELPGNYTGTAGEHYNKNKNKELRIKKGESKIDSDLAAKEKAAMARAPNTDGVKSASDIVRLNLRKKGFKV